MKINLTKLYLEKLSSLANKFHQSEASIKDLEQLRLLVNAFHAHVNMDTEQTVQMPLIKTES